MGEIHESLGRKNWDKSTMVATDPGHNSLLASVLENICPKPIKFQPESSDFLSHTFALTFSRIEVITDPIRSDKNDAYHRYLDQTPVVIYHWRCARVRLHITQGYLKMPCFLLIYQCTHLGMPTRFCSLSSNLPLTRLAWDTLHGPMRSSSTRKGFKKGVQPLSGRERDWNLQFHGYQPVFLHTATAAAAIVIGFIAFKQWEG